LARKEGAITTRARAVQGAVAVVLVLGLAAVTVFVLRPPSLPPPTPLPGPVFNVSNFGAQGNGVSDDTAALQAALNVAVGSGGSVYAPAGTYLISSALSYGGGFTLAGDGMAATTIANTTSRLGTTAMFRPTQDGLANVTVQGVTFDQRGDYYDRNGDSYSEWLLDVRGTSNMTVQDCGFRHVRTIGIYSDTTAGATVVGLKVLRNHVFEADGDGFSWFGSFRDFVIDSNIVENTKDDAIATQDKASGEYPTNIRISNNTIRNCVTRTNFGSTPNGIQAYGSDHVTIVGNTITNVLSNGIFVDAGASRRGTYTWISNNVVSGAGAKNTTTDVPANGVSLRHTDHVYLSGNTVTNSKYLDYNIVASTDVQGDQ
jgi:Pectate lyase superfamily protein